MMKTGIARLENLEIEIVTEMPREDILKMANMVIKQECGNYGLSKLQLLGTGAFGRVFAYKDYAIKHLRKDRSLRNDGSNDVSVLKGLQHLDCVPTLYAVIGDKAIITSRVDGMTVDNFKNEVDYGDAGDEDMNFISPAFEEMFVEAMQQMFLAGYEPRDLHQANVMIERGTGRPIIVDFGKFQTVTRSYIETLKDENGNIDITRNAQTQYWKENMSDNVSVYTSAKRNRERLNMKQEKMEQIDAIHNPAEIGEMLLKAKEEPQGGMLKGKLINSHDRAKQKADEIYWNKHVEDMKDLKNILSEGVVVNLVGAQGKGKSKLYPCFFDHTGEIDTSQ